MTVRTSSALETSPEPNGSASSALSTDASACTGVAYMGPGKVEVHDTDYPTLELRDGPGVNRG